MAGDPARTSAEAKFNELMLGEMRAGLAKLGEKVDSYRDESVILHSKLDLHIATCDLRYRNAVKPHDATPQATPALPAAASESALFSRKRIIRKMFDGVAEHAGLIVVLTIIQMGLFAWQHGYRPSVPDLPAATKTTP